MRADVPASVLEFLKIPGLAPEKVARIHELLGITTLADLEQACRENRPGDSKGLGTVPPAVCETPDCMLRGPCRG